MRPMPALKATLLRTILFLPLLLSGCGNAPTQPKYVEQVAVSAYLYVGEAVSRSNPVVLTRTRPVDEYYDASEAAIRDAVVTLRADDTALEDTLWMVAPGRYANPAIVIRPRTTYHLKAQAGGATISASTTTPIEFNVLSGPLVIPDVMRHAAIADSFPLIVNCLDPEQIFLVDLYCLEAYQNARYVLQIGTAEYPKDYAEYGGDNREPRHISAYFRLKDLGGGEAGYRLSFYGDMMAFYGEYRVGVFSIDQNYYNYLYREHPELNSGIRGGIGVFGSACRRQYHVKTIE
jgi:hypothetical protein